MTEFSALDKNILNELQGNLPLSPRPFADIAEKIGCREETVIERIRALKESGYIRRIGAFFESGELGYHGALIALRVKESCMASVAQHINGYAGVTHNYEREGSYNLWFTLHTRSPEEETRILDEIRALDGVERLLNLKVKKKYKINVQFQLK